MIKFWSYKREYSKYNKVIQKKINSSLMKGQIFFGQELQKFERQFVKKYRARYGVAVKSGTDALMISLKAIGIKNGDEVITAANTAIPTISAIRSVGAIPKLVDIKDDYLIDVQKIKNELTKKTKVIIPVHLYGQTCDMNEISKIARKHNIKIIEDCAQSQGAKFLNNYSGTIGQLGCFSFYPTKILGAYGDGGFILTNSYSLFKKIRRIRFYGIETLDKKNKYYQKYYSNEDGLNSRMDEIQAAILNFKFSKLDKFIKRRKNIADRYYKKLKSTNLKLPKLNLNCDHVYHQFTVYHHKRNIIMKELKKRNIETKIIYPYPIHQMQGYKKFFSKKKNLKNSETKSKGIFCLPIYPELKNKEVDLVCKNIQIIMNKFKL